MARLSKHGAEILRIAVEYDTAKPESSVVWERLTRAYMADGKILEKRDVTFKPNAFETSPRPYSFGWKLGRRQLKATVDIRTHVEKIARIIRDTPNETKWRIVAGGEPPVVLSIKRIMQAIESGENAGFCKACGAEADGCEPDARNYLCESCGAREVYGAEECLVGG